ncbi:50S ribosomal protein L18 [Chlamydiota bacterium]
MASNINREKARKKRQLRIRNKIVGTKDIPRMNIFRSLNNIYVQLIDDNDGKTLVEVSTLSKEIRDSIKKGSNIEAAKVIGKEIAERAKKVNIKKVVFDRGGYKFHGRVKAIAEAAVENGLII